MPQITPANAPKVGVDVPWVVSWSAETPAGIGPCPTIDGQMAALQKWAPGSGEPLYAKNHLRRQRDSVRAMLCPMCGKITPRRDRWTQTGRLVPTGVLRARGFAEALPADLDDARLLLDVGAIAPLHRACAEAAQRDCPDLNSRPDQELKEFPLAWVVVPLYAQAQDIGRTIAVVTFLQLVGVTEGRDENWREQLPQG